MSHSSTHRPGIREEGKQTRWITYWVPGLLLRCGIFIASSISLVWSVTWTGLPSIVGGDPFLPEKQQMWAVRGPWGNFLDISKLTLCFYSHSSGHSTFYPSSESLYLRFLLDYGEAEGRASTVISCLQCLGKHFARRTLDVPCTTSVAFGQCASLDVVFGIWEARGGLKSVYVQLTVLILCVSLECRECSCFHLPYENAGPKETWGGLPPWDGGLRSNFKSWLILKATHS